MMTRNQWILSLVLMLLQWASLPSTGLAAEPMVNGIYQLQQARVRFQIGDSQTVVDTQFLRTPDQGVVGVLLSGGQLSIDTGENLKIFTEAVMETLLVQNQKVYLQDQTPLWNLVILVASQEVHLQDVRKEILDLDRELLKPESLQSIRGLEVISTNNGLVVRYPGVELLYTLRGLL